MRWALVRISVAVTAMVVLAFAVPLGLVVKQVASDRAMSQAERQAAAVAPALAITTDRAQLQRAVASTDAGADGRMAVHVPDDELGNEPSSEESADADPEQVAEVIGNPRTAEVDIREPLDHGRAVSHGVEDGAALLQPIAVDGGRTAVVEVFVPDAELTNNVGTSWLILAVVGVALILGSVGVADRLGRRTVRPAEELASAARELGEGRLSVRVPEQGPTELRSAAVAFNAMARQVSGLLDGEREMAADLSHRLRTPLTVLRLNAASLGDGDAAEQTRQAADQLECEVDTIIETARAHQPAFSASDGGAGSRADTDASEVIGARMAFWSALAEDEGRNVRLAGTEQPTPVPVARAELTAAIDALLGNVFRHTAVGVTFAVDVYPVGEDSSGADPEHTGAVLILVSDAGEGIADPDRALRRGQGDGGPGSTGLGLDIVRRVAESTGGEVRIGRSVLGGAEISVRLSRAGRPAGLRPSRRAARRRATSG